MTCKDGHVRDALISGRVQDDLLLVSLIDISALKQAQAVLRESEERFRKLFEDTRLATVLLEDGRYIAANQAALAMLRFDHLDQIIGLTPGDLSPALQPDGRSSVEKAADLMRLTRESGTQEAEWTLIRADGEHFIGHVTITQIPQGGKELLHITTLDITEQKKGPRPARVSGISRCLDRSPEPGIWSDTPGAGGRQRQPTPSQPGGTVSRSG